MKKGSLLKPTRLSLLLHVFLFLGLVQREPSFTSSSLYERHPVSWPYTNKPTLTKKIKIPLTKLSKKTIKVRTIKLSLIVMHVANHAAQRAPYEHKKEDILNDIKDQWEEKALRSMKKTAPKPLILLMTFWIVLMNPSLMT